MSDTNTEETKVIDVLENDLFELLVEIRARERRVEKIKMAIRAFKPDFVDLDVMEVISKPLLEQLSPIDGKEERPHKSEQVDSYTRAQAEKQE